MILIPIILLAAFVHYAFLLLVAPLVYLTWKTASQS